MPAGRAAPAACARRPGSGSRATDAAGCPRPISSAWFGPVRNAARAGIDARRRRRGRRAAAGPSPGSRPFVSESAIAPCSSRSVGGRRTRTSATAPRARRGRRPRTGAARSSGDRRDQRLERHVRAGSARSRGSRAIARAASGRGRRASPRGPRRASTHANAVPHEPPPTTSARIALSGDTMSMITGQPCSPSRSRRWFSR